MLTYEDFRVIILTLTEKYDLTLEKLKTRKKEP